MQQITTLSYDVTITAREANSAEGGSYFYVYDVFVSLDIPEADMPSQVEAKGLLQDPTVRMIQALTGLPIKHLRAKCVMAQDDCLRERYSRLRGES